jgi:hypothetical protein
MAPALPDRIVQLIAKAPYAHLVVRSETDRAVVLPEIISLHTKQELLEIEGLGPETVKKLETWLAHYHGRLRQPDESLDAVICRFSFRSDRVRRLNREHARHNAGVNAQMDPISTQSHA